MANTITSRPEHESLEAVLIEGAFRPNGVTNPDNTLNEGVGFSVTRTGVGAFLITLDAKWARIVKRPTYQLHLNAPTTDQKIVGGAVALNAAGKYTLALQVVAIAAASEVASNANNWISFSVTVGRTRIKK